MKLIRSTFKQKVLVRFGNTRVIWEKAYYTTQSIRRVKMKRILKTVEICNKTCNDNEKQHNQNTTRSRGHSESTCCTKCLKQLVKEF